MLDWVSRLAGGKRGEPVYPAIDAETVLYVIGDIHGRADLLRRVHEAIERDWEAGTA